MPDDSGGIYTVPSGTIVNTGDTLLPSQHNPWALDNASAVSARFSKDGRAPATGNWNMNTFRITGLGAPTGANDATSKTYVDTAVSTQGFLIGLGTQPNAVDAVNDIDIAAGAAAADTTPFATMRLASAITKRIDANWVVGTGNGGLDTGAVADGTYLVWEIQRPDTGLTDVLFSLSATSPTMPASYTLKRRIGSVIRSGGANRNYSQFGDMFVTSPISNRSSTAAFPPALFAVSVPAGIRVIPLLTSTLAMNASSSATVNFGNADSASVVAVAQSETGSSAIMVPPVFWTDTSRQLWYQVNITLGTVATCTLGTYGWIDPRGRW